MTCVKATFLLFFVAGGWLLFLPSLSATAPQVWYVSTKGNDANDCRTPVSPCATVEAVLARVEFQDSDIVYVTAGLYQESEGEEEALLVNRDATIWGGWNTDFTMETEEYSEFSGFPYNGITVIPDSNVTLRRVFALGGEYVPGLERSGVNERGGLRNYGNLFLVDSRVNSDLGYGILNEGTITVTNVSLLPNFGTGIINRGHLRMIASHLSSGDVEAGCGNIENRGTLYIESSGISSGEARYGVGGLCNYGDATIVNSMMAGNHANGPYPDDAVGAIANYGTLTVTNSAIFSNSGMFESASGIYNTGELYLANTSIAGNSDDLDLVSVGGNVYTRNSLIENCTGIVTSDGYNLLAHSAGCDWHSATGDRFDQNPFVAALLKPRIGSPLINHGNPDGCEAWDGTPLDTDKDGSPRWQICDIGAYEYVPSSGQIFTHHLPFVERAIIE